MTGNQLWGGRFEKPLHPDAFALGRSLSLDIRLLPYDIRQSLAYLQALHEAGIVKSSLQSNMSEALRQIEREFLQASLASEATDEDVHGLVERLLTQRVGPEASIIRVGRSRNDQVATDFKLFLRDATQSLQMNLQSLLQAIVRRSEELVDVYTTSYTHTQRAQPILLSQELLKHCFAIARNIERFDDWKKRHNSMPLGSGASAGSSFPLNFEAIAATLGFDSITFNSLDGTSSRDFVSEFLFICAQIALDISRMAEEIILWSTKEFGYILLPDEFSTGSSLMPQKRNPDFAELARGKTGRVVGNLMNVLTVLKALPFGYNRDLQEDKFPVFDSIDTLDLVLPAMTGMFTALHFNREHIQQSVSAGHILATDIAEWLVSQGMAFKEAHDVVGQLVMVAERLNLDVADLTFEQFKSVSAVFNPGVMEVLDIHRSIENRKSPGATSTESVMQQISLLRQMF